MRIYIPVLTHIAVAAVLLASSVAATASPRVTVDGKTLRMTPKAVIRNGRVFVPVTVLRKIGLAVEMRGKRQAWVGWPESDATLIFTVGTMRAGGGYGRVQDLPAKIITREGAIMVPLSAVVSARDPLISVSWDAQIKTAEIHRSPKWLAWRMKMDDELRQKRKAGWYETPI